jgi:tripartite-type tricarboxylate transporter receptor subunit TctC
MHRRAFLQLSAAAPLLLSRSPSSAQSAYPSERIDVVIAFPPGGPADTAPRIAIEYLRPLLNNANLVPNNKPGAGGGIGAEYVAKSRPDGYTILATGNSTLSVKTAIEKSISYKIEDFAAVGMYAVDVGVLAVQRSLGIATVEQLVDYAKKNPDQLSYASAGQGTAGHISAELFKHATGIKMVHVPFRGAGPAAHAMLSGDVQLTYGAYTAIRSILESGKVVPLITSATRRIPALPDVPTLAEKGHGGSELNIWSAFYVPAATPRPVLQKLTAALAEVSRQPAMIAALAKAGLQPDYGDPARALQLLKQEQSNVANLAKVVELGG